MDLARTQFMSLVTKAVTLVLGVAQSVIVIRLLTSGEYGLVGLVMSIGGVIGVTQHLGIVDGAIREIAVLKKKEEMGVVFWVSHVVRQIVTVPLSIGLIALASIIAARIYHRPEITPFIQMYAAVLILQGLQDVLGATLTGLKKFKELYAIQIVTAAINIAVFGLLTWQYRIGGFFAAVVITTSIMIAMLGWVVWKELRGHLRIPSIASMRFFARRVMRIGVYMYLSRIFFVVWQRLPMLLLGGVVAADELGYLNVSLTFGSKLTIIAAALSEVNLSWMSSLFATKQDEFRRVATRNMQRVLVLLMSMTLVLVFFAPEILRFVVGAEYLPAQRTIIVMTLAFFLYSLMDVGTSSVLVSANQPRLRAAIYAAMTGITGAVISWALWQKPNMFIAACGVLAGALVAYLATVIFTKKRFQVDLVTRQLVLFLIALFVSSAWLLIEPHFLTRLVVFVLLGTYIAWEAHRSKLVPMNLFLIRPKKPTEISITCFAGAPYDMSSWTNRQHVMSRISQQYRVLYVEPRMWIVRYILQNLHEPRKIGKLFKKLLWYEKKHDRLYIKAQWNLIPWSRESRIVSWFNHYLNRYPVLFTGWFLGFTKSQSVLWIYDTEAAEYLSAFKDSVVVYDCVDDHAAQAGQDRNPKQVHEEEEQILKRADLVTVTSCKLLEQKKALNHNIHLVLNAGDVELFMKDDKPAPALFESLKHPILGSVGALDSYKLDFDLIQEVVRKRPDWQFVFIGTPVVERSQKALEALKALPNVTLTGPMKREDVPAYVHQFDVCLIPYRRNQYNEASFPLKFWEFMATGKQIVVSGLPELKEFSPLIGYAETADEFIKEVEERLTKVGDRGEERKQLAVKHGWQNRVDELLDLLRSTIQRKTKPIQ